jgi:hypothetical protein
MYLKTLACLFVILFGAYAGSSLEARTYIGIGLNVIPQVRYPCYVEECYPCETVIVERPYYVGHVRPGYRVVPAYPVYRERVMVAPIVPSFSFNFFR